jgi:[ribosomal protein S18]-alanine N-acetyltransferase
MTTPPDLKNVSVLWASVDHAEALAACHADLFAEPWNKAAFEGLLSHPGSTALIARQGNPQQTIGFIVGQLAADEAEILTFGVAKDWQRKGIGRKLIEGLARAVKRAEAKRLFLEVADDNLPAMVLYSRMGFKEAGRRKGYYVRTGAPAADALVLSLTL